MANNIKKLVNKLTYCNTFAIKKALQKQNASILNITEFNNKKYKKIYKIVKLEQSDDKSDINSENTDILILIFSCMTIIYLEKCKAENA